MQPRTSTNPPALADPFTLAAGTWLASGLVLLGLTPLPLHDASLGWTATFWLVLAPALMLAVRLWCRQTPRVASASARRQAGRNLWPRDRTRVAASVRHDHGASHSRARHEARRAG